MRSRIVLTLLAAMVAMAGCDQAGGISPLAGPTVPISSPEAVPQATSQPDKAPPAQPKNAAVAPEPRSETAASTSGQSQPRAAAPRTATTPATKEVFTASVLQVNKQYLNIDEIIRSRGDELKAIPKSITEERFRQRAYDILADESRRQVSECLVYTEAFNRLDDDQKKKLDSELETTTKQLTAELGGGSKTRLEQVLAEQGTTLQTLLNNHKRRLVVQSFMHEKLESSVKINRNVLWDYYTKHTEEFAQPKKVAMQTITVPFSTFLSAAGGRPSVAELDAAKKQARDRIAQAAAELKAGKSFSDVAMLYSKDSKASDGGLWPAMTKGSYRDEKVEAAAFALDEGKTSEIVTTDSACVIVRAAKVVPGTVMSFEDAQPAIETKIRQEQERKLTEEYFNKLVEASTITQYNRFLETAVERAVERFYRGN